MPLWSEVHPKDLSAIKQQPSVQLDTVVTPFVYECFKHLRWGRFLKMVKPSRKVSLARRDREEQLHLTGGFFLLGTAVAPREKSLGAESTCSLLGCRRSTPPNDSRRCATHYGGEDDAVEGKGLPVFEKDRIDTAREKLVGCVVPRSTRLLRDEFGTLLSAPPETVAVGDVISVIKDRETVWKGSSELWYAYVQGVHVTASGRCDIQVIWLYEPSIRHAPTCDTPSPTSSSFRQLQLRRCAALD